MHEVNEEGLVQSVANSDVTQKELVRSNVRKLAIALTKRYQYYSYLQNFDMSDYFSALCINDSNYSTLKLALYISELSHLTQSDWRIYENGDGGRLIAPAKVQSVDLPLQKKTFSQYCRGVDILLASHGVDEYIKTVISDYAAGSKGRNTRGVNHQLIVNGIFSKLFIKHLLDHPFAGSNCGDGYTVASILSLSNVKFHLDDRGCMQVVHGDYIKSLFTIDYPRIIDGKMQLQDGAFTDVLAVMHPHVFKALSRLPGDALVEYYAFEDDDDDYVVYYSDSSFQHVIDYLAYKCLCARVNFIEYYNFLKGRLYHMHDYERHDLCYEMINLLFEAVVEGDPLPLAWQWELIDVPWLHDSTLWRAFPSSRDG